MTKQTQIERLALVNFTQSWRLKALGFNLPCRYYYDEQKKLYHDLDLAEGTHHNEFVGVYSAPEVELAVQYVREVLELDCYVQVSCWDNSRAKWYGILPFADHDGIGDKRTETFDKFSQASSALLDEALASLEGRSSDSTDF